jgi:hypothetical protein
MSSGDKKKAPAAEKGGDDAPKTVALDAGDLKLLQTYGIGPYTRAIKTLEGSITEEMKKIVDLIGARASPRARGQTASAPRPSSHSRAAHTQHPTPRASHLLRRREGERHWPGAALHVGPAQ